MSFPAAIGNAPSLNVFSTESLKNEAVALKKDGLQAQPAKQGFFGRIMQWVRGENPARINSATKDAFVAALSRKYGNAAADAALAQTGFYRGNDQPLTSREIKLAIGSASKQAASLGPGSGSSAQSLTSATKDMLKTRADSVQKGQEVKKLTALVARLRASNDPRLGAAQNKLNAAKQDWQQIRSQLDGQAKKIAAGELPISPAGAQPSGSTPARDAQSKQESRALNNEARIQQKEQNAAMRAESKQNFQEMREQAKLAREQSRADQQALRNERSAARQVATQQQQVARAEQRELRAQAKLERSLNAQQHAEKTLESAEKLLNQTSRMLEDEEAALMAEFNDFVGKVDAFSEALARPIGRR